MAMIGENQVRNFFIVNTSSNTTMSTIRGGANLNGAVIQSDGTAAVADEEFALAVKNNQGELSMSDIINPLRVTSAKAIAHSPRVGQWYTISGIGTPTAGTLYQVRIIFKGYGSLSVENEYIKEAYYKAVTGDNAEDVVDGLVKSLARNFSREQPEAGTTFSYTDGDLGAINLPDNLYLDFIKSASDGDQETATFEVTANPTAEGFCTVTLNGTAYSVPMTISTDGTFADAAAELALGINAIPGYSATASTATVTVVSDLPGVETDASFAAGTATSMACTVTTTQQGTAGTIATAAQLTIREKDDYLSTYYNTGKKDRLNLVFEVLTNQSDLTITSNTSFSGIGTGYEVRNLEYYFLGNRGDTFRGMGYPHNFDVTYDSSLTGIYYLIELEYNDEGRDDPMKSKKQLTIACPSKAVANTLIGQINTALTNVAVAITAFPA